MSFEYWHSKLEKLYGELYELETEISDTIEYAIEDLLEDYGFKVCEEDYDSFVRFVGRRKDVTVEVRFNRYNHIHSFNISYEFYTDRIEGYELAEMLDATWKFSEYGDGAARDELSLNDFVSDLKTFMEVLDCGGA